METDSSPPRGGAQRQALADPGDDLSAPTRRRVFLAMDEYVFVCVGGASRVGM
jgi:hypothetical protein